MNKLCFASHNKNKAQEISQILSIPIVSLDEIGCFEDIEETENTMQGNSLLKAKYVFDKYGIDCFADDSGLEVFALSGAPGVFSARYAGEHGNHAANNALLLKNLEGVTDRKARFRTVITLILAGQIHTFEGIVNGEIIEEKRGEAGFGYDPIFIPEGYETTFAQMTLAEKNLISHRARAIDKMKVFLSEIKR